MIIRNFVAALAGVALVAMLGSAAYAESPAKHKGLYVWGGLGMDWAEDSNVSGADSGKIDFEGDWAGAFSVGYGFGNGLRLEGEMSHRRSDVTNFSGTGLAGEAKVTGFMANLLYDFDVSPRFIPYIGVGAGLAVVRFKDVSPIAASNIDDEDNVFAWQGLAGVAVPLTDQLDLTADYRYFDTNDVNLQTDAGGNINSGYTSHSVMLGLRYRFAAPRSEPRPRPAAAVAPPLRPAPAPAPKPKPKPVAKPKPAPAPPRSFLVFFDWDKANVRPDAEKVLEAAADYAKNRGLARINLTGYADRSGPASYNMRLSVRRAQNVKAAMVKLGISPENISVVGRGESDPLVPTADGVREPRNRRVEIAF